MSTLSLRFIAGVHRGLLVPLPEEGEVVLGRGQNVQVVLAEEAVSRQHCRIWRARGLTTVEDLGSTNGTFLNGQRLAEASPLGADDRLLIGTSVVQVVDEAALAAAPPSPPDGGLAPPRREASEALSGRLDKMALPDVLQLLGAGKRSGQLWLELPGEPPVVGTLTLADGQLVGVAMPASPHWGAAKALARLAREAIAGHFRFRPHPPPPTSPQVPSAAEQLLAANDDADKVVALGHGPLGPDSQLRAPTPMAASLRDLDPAQLDLWQLAIGQPVAGVLDASPRPDGEVLERLKALLDGGYLAG